jgi:UPF0176 protein
MNWKVAAFYRFLPLTGLPELQAEITENCARLGVCGTILLAPEGINGTIAGHESKLDEFIALLDRLIGITRSELKFSTAVEKPFGRLKVRVKREIITLRAPEADPAARTGTHVDPREWNELMNDPEVVVLDTRNDYETQTGIFRGAVDPGINTFTQFKDFAEKNLDPAKHKKIAMYCTGGIRCEKASSYLLAHGFKEVYQLKGGILKYLEDIPPQESRWQGACFVFDERAALGHGLAQKPRK